MATGAKVKVLVSVGQPQVVYTNGKDILRLNGATACQARPGGHLAGRRGRPDLDRRRQLVAYTADGRVMLKDLTKKNSSPVPLTPEGERYADLAWAPTADVNLIAMRDDPDDGDSDLCLANVKSDETDITLQERAVVHDHPRAALGPGRALDPRRSASSCPRQGDFGIVRWRVKSGKPAFSPDLADWTNGRFLTDTDTPDKGVLDAEVSPDGKRLALISNQGSSAFQLWLADDPAGLRAVERQADRRCGPARCRGAATARSC